MPRHADPTARTAPASPHPPDLWRRLPAILAAVALLGLLVGCASTSRLGLMTQEDPLALAKWQQARAARQPIRHANLFYVGVSVHDHRHHAQLPAWRHSRQLLDRAFASWLDLPPHRRVTLDSPDHDTLQDLFTRQLPATLKPTDTLVIYLGTHQLRDGRVLLGDGTHTRGDEFARWLNALPNRVVLLADTCYGEIMEKNAHFSDRVARIYASRGHEEATEVFFMYRDRETQDYFAATSTVIESELAPLEVRYSVMGLLLVHTLRLEIAQTPAHSPIRLDAFYHRLSQEQARFVAYAKRLKLHLPEAHNVQPWPLILLGSPAADIAGDRGDLSHSTPPPTPAPAAASGGRVPSLGPAHHAAPARQAAAPARQAAGDTAYDRPTESASTSAAIDSLATLVSGDGDGDQIDLTDAFITMGRIVDPELDTAAVRERLDRMEAELRRQLRGVNAPRDQLDIINTHIYQTQQYRPLTDPYARDFLLDEVVIHGRGRCSAFSALFLVLAQRLDLPLVAVCLPEHIFVRWPIPGQTPMNIETTMGGVIVPDRTYLTSRPWASSDAADAFYMQPLNRRQTVAAFLSPLSSALRKQQRLDAAIRVGRLATQSLPQDAEAWNNLGMALRLDDQMDDARAAYQRALAINAHFAEAWNNLASTEPAVADRIPLYRKAVALKPELADAWRNLAYAYHETENYQMAQLAIKRCYDLGRPVPRALADDVRRKLQ